MSQFLKLVLWSLWIVAPYWIFGSHSYVRWHDNGDGSFPMFMRYAHDHGLTHFGFWMSHWGLGIDTLANAEVNLFLLAMFTVFPGWVAYTLVLLLQRVLWSYFIYRLLLDELKAEKRAALLAALCAPVLFYFNLQWGLAISALPLVLWALARFDRDKAPMAALGALGLAVGLSSPYTLTLFTIPLAGLWFIVVQPKRKPRFWIGFALHVACLFIAWSPYIRGALANSPMSHRMGETPLSATNVDRLLELIEVLKATWWACLVIAIGFVTALRKRASKSDSTLKRVLVYFAICFGLSIFSPLIQPLFGLIHKGLEAFTLERFSLGIPLALVLAAGLTKLSRRAAIVLVLALALQTAVVFRAKFYERVDGWNYATMYKQPALTELANTIHASPEPSRAVTVVSMDGPLRYPHPCYLLAYGIDITDGYLGLYSRRYHDLWLRVIDGLKTANPADYDYYRYWGNRVHLLLPVSYVTPTPKSAPAPAVLFDKLYRLNLLSLLNTRYVVTPVPTNNPALRLVHAPTQAEYDSWADWDKSNRLSRLWLNFKLAVKRSRAIAKGDYASPFYIYENTEALPRFFLAHEARVLKTGTAVLNAMEQSTSATLKNVAFFNNDDLRDAGVTAPESSPATRGDELTIMQLTSDRIRLKTRSTGIATLVLSQNYSPFWTATIDGKPAKLVPVDHALQGVPLTAGTHDVIVEYRPPYRL